MFTIREGPTGGGKSYTTVNFDVADELLKGRPVYTSLEIDAPVFVAWLTQDRGKQRDLLSRLHFLHDREEIPRNPDGTERVDEKGVPLGPRHMLREGLPASQGQRRSSGRWPRFATGAGRLNLHPQPNARSSPTRPFR
jgi:Zonular occludens toxin (Zot).